MVSLILEMRSVNYLCGQKLGSYPFPVLNLTRVVTIRVDHKRMVIPEAKYCGSQDFGWCRPQKWIFRLGQAPFVKWRLEFQFVGGKASFVSLHSRLCL